jgi:Na+/H+ antiporter NhaD/arsenite permease-like protein
MILLASAPVGITFPIWSVAPFLGMLLTLGVMSFAAANFPHSTAGKIWESNRNKLFIALGWSLPVLALLAWQHQWLPLYHSMEEYFAFITLLFALFCISGGVYVSGDIAATPKVNTLFLAGGALLANFIGTTGASVLLIRPLLRTNAQRKNTTHLPVFFIFAVSNIGGCLLPIGDPPLFLGYLQGVPFFWTLRLWPAWLTAMGLLLVVFYIWDRKAYLKESAQDLARDVKAIEPLEVHGKSNFILLAGVLAAVIWIPMFWREAVMLLLTGASFFLTPLHSKPRKENNFTFGPIIEVAVLFIGIFIAMIPALSVLREHGTSLGLSRPWHFFWASGTLSSVLDNAPTYLTFLSVAQSLSAAQPGLFPVSPELQHIHAPGVLLVAVSLGSVFMGAMTYIGNGPNFMVKAIADEWGYKTPDFFSYVLRYSIPILVPIFIVVSVLFLR